METENHLFSVIVSEEEVTEYRRLRSGMQAVHDSSC